MSNERIYLAGPMRGLPKYNCPAFAEAATNLREAGYTVVSPHELDAANGLGVESPELTTKEYMARDLPALLSCDAIALLPGWTTSVGAAIEYYVANSCGMPVYTVAGKVLKILNIWGSQNVK